MENVDEPETPPILGPTISGLSPAYGATCVVAALVSPPRAGGVDVNIGGIVEVDKERYAAWVAEQALPFDEECWLRFDEARPGDDAPPPSFRSWPGDNWVKAQTADWDERDARWVDDPERIYQIGGRRLLSIMRTRGGEMSQSLPGSAFAHRADNEWDGIRYSERRAVQAHREHCGTNDTLLAPDDERPMLLKCGTCHALMRPDLLEAR